MAPLLVQLNTLSTCYASRLLTTRRCPPPPAMLLQISRLLAQSFAGFEELYDTEAPQPSPAQVRMLTRKACVLDGLSHTVLGQTKTR